MRSHLRRPPAPLTFSRRELKHWARDLGLNVWPCYCKDCGKVTPHNVDTDECADCQWTKETQQ